MGKRKINKFGKIECEMLRRFKILKLTIRIRRSQTGGVAIPPGFAKPVAECSLRQIMSKKSLSFSFFFSTESIDDYLGVIKINQVTRVGGRVGRCRSMPGGWGGGKGTAELLYLKLNRLDFPIVIYSMIFWDGSISVLPCSRAVVSHFCPAQPCIIVVCRFFFISKTG